MVRPTVKTEKKMRVLITMDKKVYTRIKHSGYRTSTLINHLLSVFLHICPGSSMDRMRASEAFDPSSNLGWGASRPSLAARIGSQRSAGAN